MKDVLEGEHPEKKQLLFFPKSDQDYLLQNLQVLGIQARFVTFTTTDPSPPCAGMGVVHDADPRLMQQILSFYKGAAETPRPCYVPCDERVVAPD